MSPHSIDLRRLLAEAPFVHALAHRLVDDEADDVVQQAFLLGYWLPRNASSIAP